MDDDINAIHYSKNSAFQKSVAINIFDIHKFIDDEKILDVGCGDGYISSLMSDMGTVIGIDQSGNMIDYAKTKYSSNNLRFENSKIEEYSNEYGFSLITAFNSIYWCMDTASVISKIFRLLISDGKLLIVTYPKESPYWSPFVQVLASDKWKHRAANSVFQNWLSEQEYKDAFVKSGFELSLSEAKFETIKYSNNEEFKDYVKGWIPCLLKANQEEQSEFVDDVFALASNDRGEVIIEYKKLMMYGIKP